MEIAVYNQKGEATGSRVQLADTIFGIKPSQHSIYMDVRLILANQRLGTHKTKERGEVRGTTKKPYRQKGTGNARAGHMRSPLMRHGGTIFGPRPHKYGFKVNRKIKQLARKSALSDKTANNRLTVLDNLVIENGKTKAMIQVIENLKLTNQKALFVLGDLDPQVHRAGSNLPKVNVVHVNELNTYDIVNAEHIIIVQNSLPVIEKNLGTLTR